MSRVEREQEFVEALARGIAVLEAFDALNSELTLTEVSRRAGISPASARRSLHTLVTLGYVKATENRRYVLGAKILTLGSSYLRTAHVDDALLPELRRIVSLFGDAASVGVLNGQDVVYIAHFAEQRGVRPVAGIGVAYPAYATSMGRVLLAGFRPPEVERYLAAAKLQKLTDYTETDRERLREIIDETRRRGHAVTVDQLAYGVTALAVPIRLANMQTVAAINSSGYTGHLTVDKLVQERVQELQVAAMRIAEAIERYPALRHSILATPEWAAPSVAPDRADPA